MANINGSRPPKARALRTRSCRSAYRCAWSRSPHEEVPKEFGRMSREIRTRITVSNAIRRECPLSGCSPAAACDIGLRERRLKRSVKPVHSGFLSGRKCTCRYHLRSSGHLSDGRQIDVQVAHDKQNHGNARTDTLLAELVVHAVATGALLKGKDSIKPTISPTR